uniref:Uncharacterized protein n=1 Tax=Glossina pallidipes TaxID=7398 RepID=A0A1A9Z3E4_GLOPL
MCLRALRFEIKKKKKNVVIEAISHFDSKCLEWKMLSLSLSQLVNAKQLDAISWFGKFLKLTISAPTTVKDRSYFCSISRIMSTTSQSVNKTS